MEGKTKKGKKNEKNKMVKQNEKMEIYAALSTL